MIEDNKIRIGKTKNIFECFKILVNKIKDDKISISFF